MGRGTYLGGHSKLWVGNNGTAWGTFDGAESRSKNNKQKIVRDRAPTEKQIAEQEKLDVIQEKAVVRDFISRCVREYAANKLTAKNPQAPPILRKRVANAGGNIKWLMLDVGYQSLFHQAYCR